MPPTSAIEMVQAFQAKGYPWTYPTFDKDDEICEAVIVEMRPGVSTVVDYYSFQDGYYISVEGGHVDYKEWDHVMEYLHDMWMPDAHPEPCTGQEMWESLDIWGYTTIDREYLDTQATATLYGGEKVVITLGDVGYIMEGTSHVTWRAVINHLAAMEEEAYPLEEVPVEVVPKERDWFLVLAQIVMIAIIVFTARVVYLHGGL